MAAALVDNGTNIKHVDSSIVLFSPSTNMTRYDKADLLSLKNLKESQQPPSCYYDPNIIRLNILKFKNQHTDEMEAQMKMFREKLQNLSVTDWDPNLMSLLRNYHQALLNPLQNGYAYNRVPMPQFARGPMPQVQPTPPDIASSLQQQYQSPRRVSFKDVQQHQQPTALDKIPSYDRNMNFFDNITTTATMRPPRMGVNAFNNNSFKRPTNNLNNHNYNPNLRKPNSCATEHANSYSSSSGYFSANDTKSSCEESMQERPCEKKMSVFDQINAEKMAGNSLKSANTGNSASADTEEKEPEWFSVPATLDDFVDLHGFEDDDGSKEATGEAKQPSETQKYQQNRRSSFPNTPYIPRYQQNNSFNSNRNISYRQNNQSFQGTQPAQNSPNNQRFRNPLHYKPPQRSPNPPMVNPFFDAWRNGKFLNQQNVSFTDLMTQQQQAYPKNLPPTAMHMSEVENRMKQQQNVHGVSQIAPPAAVPQFFQNLASTWGVRVNDIPPQNVYQQRMAGLQQVNDVYKLPTQEQLQHFTSEIMRNAILRKNSQQYHDENNNSNNYQK